MPHVTKYRVEGSPYWYISYNDASGRRVRKSLKTSDRILADEKVNELRYEMDRGALGLRPRAAAVSLRQAADDYLVSCEANHAEGTRGIDRLALNRLVEFCKNKKIDSAAGITLALLEKYKIARREEKAEPSTINREITVVKSFVNRLLAEGRLYQNPFKDLAGKNLLKPFKITNKKIRFLNHDEIKRLLAIERRPRWLGIIGLALNTGMRKAEIQHMTRDKADFGSRLITVADEGAFRPKSRRIRYIPMNRASEAILRSVKVRGPYFFGVKDGARPFVNNFDLQFRKILGRAKIEGFRFQDLRHTFASHFIMSTGDLKALQEILGHSKIETTMIYAHLRQDHKRKAMEMLTWGGSAKGRK